MSDDRRQTDPPLADEPVIECEADFFSGVSQTGLPINVFPSALPLSFPWRREHDGNPCSTIPARRCSTCRGEKTKTPKRGSKHAAFPEPPAGGGQPRVIAANEPVR